MTRRRQRPGADPSDYTVKAIALKREGCVVGFFPGILHSGCLIAFAMSNRNGEPCITVVPLDDDLFPSAEAAMQAYHQTPAYTGGHGYLLPEEARNFLHWHPAVADQLISCANCGQHFFPEFLTQVGAERFCRECCFYDTDVFSDEESEEQED